jgi:hypothetical protein
VDHVGAWKQALIDDVLVDVSETPLGLCRERFGDRVRR